MLRGVIFIFAAGAMLGGAQAEIVTYRFEAERTRISAFPYDPGSDAEKAAAFAILTGEFSWDTEAGVVSSFGAVRKDYGAGVITFDQFDVSGNYTMSTVVVDRAIDPSDPFARDVFQIRGVSGAAGLGDNMYVNFVDSTATAFASTDLPQSLDFDAFKAFRDLIFTDVLAAGATSTQFRITSIEFVPGDTDGDGVLDVADICPGTVIPEAAPTSGPLGNARHALTEEGVFTFESGKAANATYTTEDTAGCSCTQIVDILVLGAGQLKSGCSNSVMEAWAQGLR